MNNLSKGKVSAYLAVIFLAGMVAGAFLGFRAGKHMMFMPPRPDTMAARASDELDRRLSLTPEQSQKIRLIVKEGMLNVQSMLGTNIVKAFSNCNMRIALELTPAQQVQFWEIEKEHEKFLNGPFKSAPENPKTTP